MARVRVYHAGVTDLARDMERIPRRAAAGFNKATRERAREGAKIAKFLSTYADNRHRPGRGHGQHYTKNIRARMIAPTKGEWGPLAGQQTGMSFEFGSRNQPYHGVLRRSADLVIPKWRQDINDVLNGLFWKG